MEFSDRMYNQLHSDDVELWLDTLPRYVLLLRKQARVLRSQDEADESAIGCAAEMLRKGFVKFSNVFISQNEPPMHANL